MLALDIHINDREHFIVHADNLAYISLSYGVSVYNNDYVSIRGTNDLYNYVWMNKAIQKGDKILVRIVDVDKDKISFPQIAQIKDWNKLKQEFEKLKLELQNKQLI
jgi:phosphoenolpyruvate-protein kinase (PTS system EI component)